MSEVCHYHINMVLMFAAWISSSHFPASPNPNLNTARLRLVFWQTSSKTFRDSELLNEAEEVG